MQKHYNYLDIDLDSKNYRKLRAMQGDTKSRYILVNLYSNNLAYDLSHCTVKIYGLKRDKTIFFNNAVVKNAKLGQFEIELTNQALAVPGELKVQILVLGTDGEKLTSSAFFIDVGESIIDENAIESTNEFGALTESLTKVNEWNGYFEETSGKIEEKYTERLNNVDSQLEQKANLHDSFFRYGMIIPTINIGDSISEGSNSLDYVNDSWCGLLNKAYQRKYNVRNQGFVNFNTYVVENNDSINTFHKIKRTGFNVHESPFEGSVYGGARITSVTADEYVEINYTGKDFYVIYTQDDTGAILDVYIDNEFIGQIDTRVLNGNKNGSLSPRVPAKNYGNHTIKLINKGGTAQLCGIIYIENSEEFSPVFYNLGRSSLTLSEIPDDLLEFYASYRTVIFSLGVNDQLLNKDIDTFKRKLHTIFSKIKEFNGNCIINDFMFSLTNSDPYKISLREIGSNYGFEVINYADLMLGGVEENKFIKYLDDDGVHLTTAGHEFVYNIISNKIGLSYKKSDLNDDIQVIEIANLKNNWVNFTDDGSHRKPCYYKKDGIVYFEGMIKEGITTAYSELFEIPPEYTPPSDIYFPVVCSGEIGSVTVCRDGKVKIVSGNKTWLSLNGMSYHV